MATTTKYMERIDSGTHKGAWKLDLDLNPSSDNTTTYRQFTIPSEKAFTGDIVLDINNGILKATVNNPVTISSYSSNTTGYIPKTSIYTVYESSIAPDKDILKSISNTGGQYGLVQNPKIKITKEALSDFYMVNYTFSYESGYNLPEESLEDRTYWLYDFEEDSSDTKYDINYIMQTNNLEGYDYLPNYYIIMKYSRNYMGGTDKSYNIRGIDGTAVINENGTMPPGQTLPTSYSNNSLVYPYMDGASIWNESGQNGIEHIEGYAYGDLPIPWSISDGAGRPPFTLKKLGILLSASRSNPQRFYTFNYYKIKTNFREVYKE